jgi:DNA polymerase-3 subunit delta'
VFLLASNGLDRLLPTILSRCRKFALPMPDHAEALAWLQAQGVQDADGWLREQGGAPLAALAQAETGSREELDALLQVLAQPSVESALRTADKLSKAPLAALVAWQQRWLYDLFSYKLSGTIRYYPRYQKPAGGAGRAGAHCRTCCARSSRERKARRGRPSAVAQAVRRRHAARLHCLLRMNAPDERTSMNRQTVDPNARSRRGRRCCRWRSRKRRPCTRPTCPS